MLNYYRSLENAGSKGAFWDFFSKGVPSEINSFIKIDGTVESLRYIFGSSFFPILFPKARILELTIEGDLVKEVNKENISNEKKGLFQVRFPLGMGDMKPYSGLLKGKEVSYRQHERMVFYQGFVVDDAHLSPIIISDSTLKVGNDKDLLFYMTKSTFYYTH